MSDDQGEGNNRASLAHAVGMTLATGLHAPVVRGAVAEVDAGAAHLRLGSGDAGYHVVKCLVLCNLENVLLCIVYRIPHKGKRIVERSTVVGTHQRGVGERVERVAKNHRCIFIAHAVQNTHGKLIALTVLLGYGEELVVGHVEQILAVAVE